MKPYYQTTPMTPSELLEATGRAISQEDRIYQFMQLDSREWTAWQLNKEFPSFCLTSIRRSLFNLKKQGKINWTGWVLGPMGVKVGKFSAFTGYLF